jgi:DNA processing protein
VIEPGERQTLQALGATTHTHPDWPDGVLRVQGSLPAPGVAIVGARRADDYGLNLARRIAMEAARRHIPVISGGAFGVDAAAHQGALDADGATAVVLGSGLSHPAPATHRPLFRRVLDSGGAVVSPFACDIRASKWTFPKRNPWIAALADTVIIVQAGQRSGTLHTARAALRMGKTVFAVPGPMEHPLHVGCHDLINLGAKVLTGVDAWCGAPGQPRPHREPTEGLLLWRAAARAASLDELAERTGLSASDAMAQATLLEMDGWLRAEAGGRYAQSRPEEGS